MAIDMMDFDVTLKFTVYNGSPSTLPKDGNQRVFVIMFDQNEIVEYRVVKKNNKTYWCRDDDTIRISVGDAWAPIPTRKDADAQFHVPKKAVTKARRNNELDLAEHSWLEE